MEFQKVITKIIGAGQFGFKLCDYIKNNSQNRGDRETLEYINIEATADNEKLHAELCNCDSVVIISDALQDFELAKKIATISKAKDILTIVAVINGTIVQQNELLSVADSVIELNINDNLSDIILHFAENISLYYMGVIGIDWSDVERIFKNSGKAYISESNAESADEIASEIFHILPKEIDCTTVKAAYIYIRLVASKTQGLEYMSEIIESISDKLNPEAEVWVNGIWGNFSESCVNVTFIGV